MIYFCMKKRKSGIIETGVILLMLIILYLLMTKWSISPFVIRSDIDDLKQRVEILENK